MLVNNGYKLSEFFLIFYFVLGSEGMKHRIYLYFIIYFKGFFCYSLAAAGKHLITIIKIRTTSYISKKTVCPLCDLAPPRIEFYVLSNRR